MQQQTPVVTAPPEAPDALARDAIIFLPGLGEWTDQSHSAPGNIARNLAQALDDATATATPHFIVKDAVETFLGIEKVQVFTIHKVIGAVAVPVIDIYFLGYQPLATKKYQEQNLLTKSIYLFVAIIFTVPKMFRAFVRALPFPLRGRAGRTTGEPAKDTEGQRATTTKAKREGPSTAKSKTQILQFFFAVTLLSLLCVYMVTLLLALYHLLPAGTRTSLRQTPNPVAILPHGMQRWLDHWFGWIGSGVTRLSGISGKIIIAATALGVFFPPVARLKEGVVRASVSYQMAFFYLGFGTLRSTIIEHLQRLIDYVVTKSEGHAPAYRNIHLMAYSFGSVVALDALFPIGGAPPPRYGKINTLITIGCPFDLVSTFWPGYFTKRYGLPAKREGWLNVYVPVDIMSSNFSLNSDAEEEATETVLLRPGLPTQDPPHNLAFMAVHNQAKLSIPALLALSGLSAHTGYWDAPGTDSVSCFQDLIPQLYREDPILA